MFFLLWLSKLTPQAPLSKSPEYPTPYPVQESGRNGYCYVAKNGSFKIPPDECFELMVTMGVDNFKAKAFDNCLEGNNPQVTGSKEERLGLCIALFGAKNVQ